MRLVEVPYLVLIPVLPLLGAVYAGCFGAHLQRRFGEKSVHAVTVALPWMSFLLALGAFVTLLGAGPDAAVYQRVSPWIHSGSLEVDLAFLVDRLSAVMALVVTFVGSLIHVYSMGYMRGDGSYWRFFSYLNLFMFSMLVLVLGDSLLLAFVGWEGVGLCSYLLIGFWYKERKNAAAGMKAFVVNRVGDAGFLLGMFLLFWGLGPGPVGYEVAPSEPTATAAHGSVHGNTEHSGSAVDRSAPAELEPLPPRSVAFRDLERIVLERPEVARRTWLGVSILTLAGLLLFVGAVGKSAQIPLYVWLPDAMAGPTPVSALIHAATMVTAGVYLVARMHFVYAMSPVAMTVVTTVGAVTALFAASIGLFQYDIKKVLAYSTVSQLGFMFVAVGVGAYWVGIFHLMTHACFKACLFLGSGSVILGCHHEQDMRKMGGLQRLMPITAWTYLLSCFAIAGFPPFSGFFSKDEILWKAFDAGNLVLPGGGLVPWMLTTTAALFTSFYMFRSYYLTFSGEYRGHVKHAAAAHGHSGHASPGDAHSADGHHGGLPHESPWSMTGVLAILGALAVVVGVLGLPELWGLPNWFERWLEPVFESSHHRIVSSHRAHAWEWGLMGFSVVVAVTGFLLARWLYRNGENPLPASLLASKSPLVRGTHQVIFRKYYVDEIYQATVVDGLMAGSRALAWIDARVVDGVVNLVGLLGRWTGNLQGFIDRVFVDGLVNLVADVIVLLGRLLRRVQTGRIQSYLYWAVAGVAVLILTVYVVQ